MTMDVCDERQVMTVPEVCKALRLNRSTVYRHAQILGGVKVGKALRFSRAFIESGIWRKASGLQDEERSVPGGQNDCRGATNSDIRNQGGGQAMGGRAERAGLGARNIPDPHGIFGGNALS